MSTEHEIRNRHFLLKGVTETEPFRSRGMGQRREVPARNRQQHSSALRGQLAEVQASSDSAVTIQRNSGFSEGLGIRVEFESFPGIELAFESLAREKSGIELLNVRQDDSHAEGEVTRATVFVPEGKLAHFESLIRDYVDQKVDSRGRPLDNRRLVDAIQRIRAATLRALWTDTSEFPSEDEGTLWWEVWLPAGKDRQGALSGFRARVEAIEPGLATAIESNNGMDTQAVDVRMRVAEGQIYFPERTIILVHASVTQMQQSILLLNSIAELRRARDTAEFFDSLLPDEQQEWLDDLIDRSIYPLEGDSVPYVCLLDTGVNRGHRLLEPALAASDVHTVQPSWGTDDGDGHGTEMAGLALAGNLLEHLVTGDTIHFPHRLESVKLLPFDGANGGGPALHGYITSEAVSRPEIQAPDRLRVFGMAVTARDGRGRGQPSAWSAAIDKLAADTDAQGANPRLLAISAGNTQNGDWSLYPDSNDTDGIHDPGQAWNALTVGAYTDLVNITEPDVTGHRAIAPGGALSPFSTTSLTWQDSWPLKPDVVMEGGNVAQSPLGPCQMDSLSLLTAFYKPNERPFTTTCATSAATAQAARLAALVMAEYPELWPETIRGLIVHSADWTQAMRQSYLPIGRSPRKADYARLMRRCGFGVPDLNRALWSLANSLTMVIEETLHPFRRVKSQQPVLRDMQLHRLPWPVEILEDLGDEPVEMRVTLSYFIEPNPSNRGVRSRYRYESHGLRFDVKRPHESVPDFRSRINLAARDEEEGIRSADTDSSWLIGPQQRHKGSIHGDIWRGTASDLASRGYVAVYPTAGWWKTRPALERYNQPARYSLIVSISTPETTIDLYTDVESKVTGYG